MYNVSPYTQNMYVFGVGNASDPIIQVTIANHQLMLVVS